MKNLMYVIFIYIFSTPVFSQDLNEIFADSEWEMFYNGNSYGTITFYNDGTSVKKVVGANIESNGYWSVSGNEITMDFPEEGDAMTGKVNVYDDYVKVNIMTLEWKWIPIGYYEDDENDEDDEDYETNDEGYSNNLSNILSNSHWEMFYGDNAYGKVYLYGDGTAIKTADGGGMETTGTWEINGSLITLNYPEEGDGLTGEVTISGDDLIVNVMGFKWRWVPIMN